MLRQFYFFQNVNRQSVKYQQHPNLKLQLLSIIFSYHKNLPNLVGSLTVQRNHNSISIYHCSFQCPTKGLFLPNLIENVLEVYKRDQDLTTMKLMVKTTRAFMF